MTKVNKCSEAMRFAEESVFEALRTDKAMEQMKHVELQQKAYAVIKGNNVNYTKQFFGLQAKRKGLIGEVEGRTCKDIVEWYLIHFLAAFFNEEWRNNHPAYVAKIA